MFVMPELFPSCMVGVFVLCDIFTSLPFSAHITMLTTSQMLHNAPHSPRVSNIIHSFIFLNSVSYILIRPQSNVFYFFSVNRPAFTHFRHHQIVIELKTFVANPEKTLCFRAKESTVKPATARLSISEYI